MKRFEGKVVLVTGAGSGIGAACVRRLFAEGATVIAVDVTEEAANTIVSELGKSDRIQGVTLDVRDRNAAIQIVADARKRFGALNGLINCAGIKGVGSIVDVEPDNLHLVIAVNLEGTINMCQAYVQAVKRRQRRSRDRQYFLGRGDPGSCKSPSICRVEIRGFGCHALDVTRTRSIRYPR